MNSVSAIIKISQEAADSSDASWCLQQYYDELRRRFEDGFDASQGFDPSDMMPPKGWLLVARRDASPIGCGALKWLGPEVGEVKRLWVSASARGAGLAGAIMDRLEDLARQNGMAKLRLDTNRTLTEAHAMYVKRGYREITRYNDNPYANHWFEMVL